jgi:hypothetical protein
MKNYAFCPVSPKVVNEKVARLNAALGLTLIVLFLFTFNLYVSVFLVYDFLVRAIDKPEYSPVALISKGLVKSFALKGEMINAGPKLFAVRVGLLFSVAILGLVVTGWQLAPLIVAGILGFFSFLEAALGYCVACKIYPFVYRWVY